MPDPHEGENHLTAPASDGLAVTPHDTTELVTWCRGIYVGVSGNVTIITPEGTTLLFVGLAAGVIHPIRAKIIKATGTAATSILALW